MNYSRESRRRSVRDQPMLLGREKPAKNALVTQTKGNEWKGIIK